MLRLITLPARIARLVRRRFGIRRLCSAEQPLVTVVVPLYNEERFILQCLKSISRQSYRNLECIVVDDCSTDRSPEIAREFCRKDSRFKIVRHERNSGLAASRNTGMREGRGEFVTFLDSDDYLLPGSIWLRVLRLMECKGRPDVVGSYCRILIVGERGWDVVPKLISLVPLDGPILDFVSSKGECPFNAHAPLLKREIALRYGGFDENLRHGAEDWEFWYRLMRNGYSFVACGAVGAVYRQKHQSMVRTLTGPHLEVALKLINGAYESAPAGLLNPEAPFPFLAGFPEYERVLTAARRLIRFGAMAQHGGDLQSLAQITSELNSIPKLLISRHLDVEYEVDVGTARFQCVPPNSLEFKLKRKGRDFSIKRESVIKALGLR